ncbi:2Fe-2S iron-sulfur cluster-binding protein [Caldimonas tepidiphila]|uniref:2Fe-2S iron-sulfur cluster-binding protein n=1 Tax=Caldimonas tepidiphila TaxID=2315841 RepID=UPI000E5BEF55|nr:2Fe-2S iron-sulfur cluster-binding protein [Caldimonas tepidiphila]
MSPVTVSLQGREVEMRPQETVLDALLRSGIDVAFSCRGGVCHACMLRCGEGEVPAAAQRGLPQGLKELGYLLACQCRPQRSLALEAPRASDLRTTCVLTAVEGRGTPFLRLRFEPMRTLAYRPGQHLRLVSGDGLDPVLLLTSDPMEDWQIEAVLHCPGGEPPLAWLREELPFGQEFEVWGPVESGAAAAGAELEPPAPDPALWHELDEGRTVRRVLEDFYAQVYADERLASFFEGVTIDRAIGKQYSFLQLMMTGEKVYFGERPRNAHHWMVISDELFDYRQALMVRTLEKHGLRPAQIARWTRFEEHWRRDMVKSAAWPKVMDGIEFPLHGYASEVLTSGSMCDHCGGEVPEGTEVLYHVRLGKISCPQCAPAVRSGADETAAA